MPDPVFESFGDIKPYSNLQMALSQKLHGCLSADTWITLADGSRRPIRDIVKSQEELCVMGIDSNGDLVPSKIVNKFNNGHTDDWLTVKVSQNGRKRYVGPRNIQVTSNHQFFVKGKGYIPAEGLHAGDVLVCLRPDLALTYLQKQVLIGKMLGDGSYSSKAKHMSFGHQKAHEAYLTYTMDCLGWCAGNKQKDRVSGYGTMMCRARTQSLLAIEELFDPWKEGVPKNISLSPIALAFWYMDDGSLSHSERQEDRASLATQVFSPQDLEVLMRELRKFEMEPVIQVTDKGSTLRLNKNSADILFTLIAPYVHPVVQYKLPVRYRGLFNFKVPDNEKQFHKPLIEQEVLKVYKRQLRTRGDKNKYDIETETHNYFADNILVHNSNAQLYVYDREGTPDVIAGSRNRWLYPHDDNYGFASWVAARKEEIIELLGPGRHFGEWVGKGINNGEGRDTKTLALFSWWRWKDKPLPEGIELVPLLYQGPVDMAKVDEVMEDLKTNGSKFTPGFMRPEGIVMQITGVYYKKVFKKEETAWDKSPGNKGTNTKLKVDFGYLMQPIRLEKLLSRDERYVREFPNNLPELVKAYIDDLVKENQIPGTEDEIKSIRKAMSSQAFHFVKSVIEDLYSTNCPMRL